MKSVGEWVLDELLGEGAFGQVYRAHAQSDPKKLAAVKVPRDDRGAALLRSESAAQARLVSAHVPKVLGVSSEPPYIAFELVPGESLRAALNSRRLEAHEVHSTSRGVLQALADAHANGMVHRDVKPENILVRYSGPTWYAYLTDFGLALPVAVEQSLADDDAGIAGSIPYLAPEVRERKTADERSDIYAWGIVLFEMLTGSLPGAAELPSTLGAHKAWDKVYERAVARREKRFATAKEALEALPRVPQPSIVPAPKAKVDVKALLEKTASEEAAFLKKDFMAFVAPDRKARARVGGKTYTFDVEAPPGLAVLRATSPTRAVVVKRFGR